MAGLEHFKFGYHAGVLNRRGHYLQVLGRVDKHAVSHVEANHVEGANVGLKYHDMTHALFGGLENTFGPRFRRVSIVMRKMSTRSGGEVDEDIGAACSDSLNDLAVKRSVHTRLSGLRITHMDVHDGGTRLGRVDRRVGDLLGRYWHCWIAASRVGRASHRMR